MDELYKKFTEGNKDASVDEFMKFLHDSKLLEHTGITEKDVRRTVSSTHDNTQLQLGKVKEVLEHIVRARDEKKSPFDQYMESSGRLKEAFEAASKAFFETLKKDK